MLALFPHKKKKILKNSIESRRINRYSEHDVGLKVKRLLEPSCNETISLLMNRLEKRIIIQYTQK